jgi:segregation and condensation protein A
MRAADLELDLDVFAGPFDLLLALVLREEVDLLEVDLAGVVLAYLDHLDQRGELDLEAATEFLVLIAALLELKSRLMLPGADDGLPELEPGEAADELLARMLEYHRYRGAATELARLLESENGYRYRSAPLPPELRRISVELARPAYDPTRLGAAIGDLLKAPPELDLQHVAIARVSLPDRVAHLRALLRRGSFGFDEAVAGADRLTVAMTLFALLELHRRGEATWTQKEPFGAATVAAATPNAGAAPELERSAS